MSNWKQLDEDALVQVVKDIADELWLRGFKLAVIFDAQSALLTVVRHQLSSP